MPNPFGTTFESLENPAGPVVESVHEAPYRRLLELIDSGDGQLISLRAPRAGYGKTMLLSRLRDKKKASMSIIPIHLADGRRVEGESILEEVLTQLAESVPGAAGLTKLDLHARKLFAHGLLPLVYSGEVPSQDKAGALDSLRERPTEAFDFHNEGAAIAQWTKSQFEVLSPRLASVLGKSSGASTRDTSYWIQLLSQFAVRTPSEASRTGDLMDTVFGYESRFRTGAGFLDGLGSLLNLITLVEPAVLILDEVDGLSSDADSALRATSSLISLWESAPRTSVIISVNDDVWDSAFAPRLPLGLRDRLEDVVIRLDSLTTEEAEALVKIRSGSHTDKVLKELDLGSAKLYPRGVLKAAREAWGKCDFREDAPKVEKAPESGSQLAAEKSPVAEFSISASKESAQPAQATQLAKSEESTTSASTESPSKKASSSKILASAAAVSSFVTRKARGADSEEEKKSEQQAKSATPDQAPSSGDAAEKIVETTTKADPSKDIASPFAAAAPKDVKPVTKESAFAAAAPKDVKPVTKESAFAAAAPKDVKPETKESAFAAAAPRDVKPETKESAFAAAAPNDAKPETKESAFAAAAPKDVKPETKESAFAAAAPKDVKPETKESAFAAAAPKDVKPVTKESAFVAAAPKDVEVVKPASSFDASPFEVTPEKIAAVFGTASPQVSTSSEEVIVKDTVASTQAPPVQKEASPFAAASSQVTTPAQEIVMKDTVASTQEPSPAKEAASVQPAESVAQAPSPFEIATPVQAPSPFDVAPAQEASPFQAQPAAAPAAVASPFQVAAAASPSTQSTLPPARPLPQHAPPQYAPPQHAPAQHSPFEAAQAPSTAMEMAPVAPVSPYGNQPAPDDRRAQRVYPSKSPFDPALAQAASAAVPAQPQAQGFPTPPAPVVAATATAASAPPIFATPASQTPASPFEANLEAKPVPPQPAVPKADTDAIDELLRQFREHRDS